MDITTIREEARALLHSNQRHHNHYTYTVPSPQLYPFQWLWDSCFHALIYLALGEGDAAAYELRAACAQPLSSGLLPHIIYWQKPDTSLPNWGREERGEVINATWGTVGTSSITQPPVIARTLLFVHTAFPERALAHELFAVLHHYFTYLREHRTDPNTKLLYIINPDESGEDNSPRYDEALGLSSTHTTFAHLEERLRLMRQHAACNFNVPDCTRVHFAVADTSFNAIYLDGLEAMATLADIVGDHSLAVYYSALADSHRTVMRSQLLLEAQWYALNINTQTLITTETWNVLMPLYAGLLTNSEARALVTKYFYSNNSLLSPYGIRSTASHEPSYDPEGGFWRGPIWVAPHWFIYQGLKRYGFINEAAHIQQCTFTLITQSGWREHYHPETGAGLGATNFTWSALALAMQ